VGKLNTKRILQLSQNKKGSCVLYVMSRDQRTKDNLALATAQKYALDNELPLAVIFVMHQTLINRSFEQYEFMLQGLSEVADTLESKNIPFISMHGKPLEKLSLAFTHFKPSVIFFDMSPFKGARRLKEQLSEKWPVSVVDTHNIVPVWEASSKQEYGARTIRPKIHRVLDEFDVDGYEIQSHPHEWPSKAVVPFAKVKNDFLNQISQIRKNNCSYTFLSGEANASKALQSFLDNRLKGYSENRNNPVINGLSNLSPYFHYGQLSTLTVYKAALKRLLDDSSLQKDFDALVEEMVVRKELSDNFCYYNDNYDSLQGAPAWALASLSKHANDERQYVYSKEQFENAQTHDQAWNAAQIQLRKQGKIHGYMRMYWAKKVLEWSTSADEAFKTLVYLNDFYSLDGGDPNGYVGILWSVAGLHDRPWGERSVYGTIRCMVYDGLRRKFPIEEYIRQQGTL